MKLFDIFIVAFVYDLSLKVLISAQNWPKTAKSSWHCSFKSHDDQDIIGFKNLRYQIFSVNAKTQIRRFQIPPGWMSVFEKFRLHDGLAWRSGQ